MPVHLINPKAKHTHAQPAVMSRFSRREETLKLLPWNLCCYMTLHCKENIGFVTLALCVNHSTALCVSDIPQRSCIWIPLPLFNQTHWREGRRRSPEEALQPPVCLFFFFFVFPFTTTIQLIASGPSCLFCSSALGDCAYLEWRFLCIAWTALHWG